MITVSCSAVCRAAGAERIWGQAAGQGINCSRGDGDVKLGLRSIQILAIYAPLAIAAGGNPLPPEAMPLSTSEIQCAFSNVRDDALVQDSAGTTAINHWYSNGSFINQWRNEQLSGEVRGRWWAEDDQRCIVITQGLPERSGVKSCTPLYRVGDRYFSVNPDGSVHGIHRLSPLSADTSSCSTTSGA